MIDRTKRNFAASLVARFRDGEICNDTFVEDWPRNRDDPVLKAISDGLWPSYDDFRNHKLVGKYALSDEGVALFDRCVAFLESDHEYEWTVSPGISTGPYGWKLWVLSFGLFFLIDLLTNYWNDRHFKRMEAVGDISVWPFIRRTDYEHL